MEPLMTKNADAISDWCTDMRRRGVLASSISARRIQVRAISRDVDLLATDLEELETWLDEREGRGGGGLSERTRYCYWSSLRAFYDWAQRVGRIDHDPTRQVIRPKLRPGLPRPIRDDLLQRALHGAKPRMTVWIMLAAYGGLRVSEIAGLARDDILDRQDPWHLHVVGKGRKERYVPVHPELRKALQSYDLPRRGPLFTSTTGRPYSGQGVSALMCAHLDRHDIEDRPHSMRHWFATAALDVSDGNLRVVQELLGHQSPNTTAIYTKLRNGLADDVVSRIAL